MPEENCHSYLSLLEILAIDTSCFSITMMKRRLICIKPRWNVLYITVQMWSALHLTWLLLLIRVKPGDWLSGQTTKTHHLSLQKDHLKHMPRYIWAIISTTLESVCPCLCLWRRSEKACFVSRSSLSQPILTDEVTIIITKKQYHLQITNTCQVSCEWVL